MTEIHFEAGCHIAKAAEQLVEAAQNSGCAFGHFNDIRLNAVLGSTAESIVEFFHDETTRRHVEYKNSPAGIAVEQEREQRRRDAQAAHDALMDKLRTLNFTDEIAVLDWICAMQEPSDQIGVIVRRKTIASAFETHGFVENDNCGDNYRPEDRNNSFRYLVGQALSCVKSGPSIHPIIHKFVGEWKARFAPEIAA